jgi:hypothetical protein
MKNKRQRQGIPEGDREAGMAAFTVAAILIVIVFAAVNGQSIVHELRIALF